MSLTQEDPVFSEVSTADEDAKPKSGGLFGLFKGKPAAASAAPVRQASFDNTPFRKFSYISPEFLDDED